MKLTIEKVRGGYALYQIHADGSRTFIKKYKTERAAEVAMMIRATNP